MRATLSATRPVSPPAVPSRSALSRWLEALPALRLALYAASARPIDPPPRRDLELLPPSLSAEPAAKLFVNRRTKQAYQLWQDDQTLHWEGPVPLEVLPPVVPRRLERPNPRKALPE